MYYYTDEEAVEGWVEVARRQPRKSLWARIKNRLGF